MKVAVVTPTIGSDYLRDCLQSVQNQSYKDITHYVFIDGKEYEHDIVNYHVDPHIYKNVKTVVLEENVGKGWYGHRVYAACSFLVNADIICYLDEDNWYDEDHIQSLVEILNRGNDWAYSLRKIVDKSGNFLCNDNCESLGKWPVYFDDKTFHIDTSSFAVKRHVALAVGHSWYGQWGADRQFFNTLKKYFPKFDCNRKFTLNYRLDGNENSVKEDFFSEGNSVQAIKYKGNFPWTSESKNELLIGPGIVLVE